LTVESTSPAVPPRTIHHMIPWDAPEPGDPVTRTVRPALAASCTPIPEVIREPIAWGNVRSPVFHGLARYPTADTARGAVNGLSCPRGPGPGCRPPPS